MSEVQHISSLGFNLNPAKKALDNFEEDFAAFEQKIIAEGKTIKQALESVLKDGIGGFKGFGVGSIGATTGQQSIFGNTSAAKDNIRKSTKELEKEYVDGLKRMGMGVKKAHDELFANGNLGAGLIDYFKGNGQKTAVAWTQEFQSHFNETNLRKIMSPFISWNVDGAAKPDNLTTDLQERFPELAQYSNVVDMWERIREAMERYYTQRKALVAGDDARAELVRYREELQNTDEMYRKVAANFDSKIGEVRSGAGIGKELYSQGDLEAMAARIKEAAGYQTKLTVETNEAGEATKATLTYVDQLNNQYREMWRYVQEVDAETGDVSEGFKKISASATQSVEATKRIAEQFNRLYTQMQSDIAKQTPFFTAAGDEGSIAMLRIIEQHMATIKGSGKEITRDQLEKLQGLRQEQLIMRDVMAGAKEQEAAKKAEKAATLETVAAYKQTYALEAKMQKLKMTDTAAYEQVGHIRQQIDALYQKLQIGEKITAEEREQVDVMRQQLSVINGQVSAEKSVQGATTTPVQGGLFARAGQWFGAYQAWHMTVRAGRELVGTMTDVETRMMEIGRVMEHSASQTDKMRDSLFGVAKFRAREFEETSEISLRFAQAGYHDIAENAQMTADALLAMNTAELDAVNSTNSMIGILKQWGLEGTELITVIDKLNYTADNNAITTQDLVDGLLRASSAAKNAKFSFDETVGTLVALREATGRTGRELGTALNSLISFTQRDQSRNVFESMGVKVYADEAETQLRPLLDVWSDLSALVKSGGQDMVDALSKMDGAMELVTEDMAEMVGMEEQFQDLFKKGMSDTDMEAVYNQASTFRRNYWIALLENFGEIQKVVGEMDNAMGHSERENARYMETLEAKSKQLIVSLQELAVQAGEAGLMDLAKGAVDAATAITGLTKGVGGLVPVILGLTTILSVAKRDKLFFNDNAVFAGAITNLKNFRNVLMQLNADIIKNGFSVKAFGSGLASALGPTGMISLAVAGIFLLKGAVNDYNQKQAEARQRDIEAGNAAYERAEKLDALIAKHDELMATGLNSDSQEFLDIEKQIIDALEGHTGRLEGLTIGTENYAAALRKANEEMRNLTIGDLERKAQGHYQDAEQSLRDNYGGASTFIFPNWSTQEGALRDYFALVERANEAMRNEEDATKPNEQISLVKDDMIGLLKTLIEIQTVQREISTGADMDAFIDEMAALYGGTEEAEAAIRLILNQMPEYASLLNGTSDATGTLVENTNSYTDAAKTAGEELETLASDLKTLEGAMETTADGGHLTLDTVLSLIDAYPKLANCIEWTAEGFRVNEQAMYNEQQAAYAAMAADYALIWAKEAVANGNYTENASLDALFTALRNATSASEAQAIMNQILAQSGYDAAAASEIEAAGLAKVNAVISGMGIPGIRTRTLSGGGGSNQNQQQIKELQNLQKETEKSYKAQEKAVKDRYDTEIDALKRLKEEHSRQDDREDYALRRAELEKEKADWQKRTGQEAVEHIDDINDELAELDRNEERRLRNNALDDQISAVETRRDAEIAAIQAGAEAARESYQAQIDGLQSVANAAAGTSQKVTEYLVDNVWYTRDNAILAWKDIYEKASMYGDVAAQNLLIQNQAMLDDLGLLDGEMERMIAKWIALRSASSDQASAATSSGGRRGGRGFPVLDTGGLMTADGLIYAHKGEVVVREDITRGLLRVVNFMNSSLAQQAGYARQNHPAPVQVPPQVIIQGPIMNIEHQEIADHADARRGAADAGNMLLHEVEKVLN